MLMMMMMMMMMMTPSAQRQHDLLPKSQVVAYGCRPTIYKGQS